MVLTGRSYNMHLKGVNKKRVHSKCDSTSNRNNSRTVCRNHLKFGVLRVLNGTLSTPIFKEIGQTVPELLLLEVGSHFEWTRFFIDTLYHSDQQRNSNV